MESKDHETLSKCNLAIGIVSVSAAVHVPGEGPPAQIHHEPPGAGPGAPLHQSNVCCVQELC